MLDLLWRYYKWLGYFKWKWRDGKNKSRNSTDSLQDYTIKNGKEIYEGDIVEFEDTGEEGYEYKEGFDFNNIAQVVYKDGIYTLANFGESDNSYYATDGTDEEILEEVLRNGNCKVIGNIYDNPELLGGE